MSIIQVTLNLPLFAFVLRLFELNLKHSKMGTSTPKHFDLPIIWRGSSVPPFPKETQRCAGYHCFELHKDVSPCSDLSGKYQMGKFWKWFHCKAASS